jgi:serine/threonine protein kinase
MGSSNELGVNPMSDQDEPVASGSLAHSIQAEHPGIHHEIEGAIRTLKKLQKITTTIAPGDDAGATVSGTIEESHAEKDEGAGARAKNEPVNRANPTLTAGESFGRYQIARALGRGSMGAVYLAYDSQLHRYVALKTPFLGDSANAVHRFYREARAAAQLRSPQICPTYDVGELSGIHFISMAFIDGRTLTRALAEGLKDDRKAILNVTKKLARGLHKAHELGIVHRDLKPDNIMVDRDGEPVVMDFGLASFLDDHTHITVAGKLLGTPVYMSPEQAEGDTKNVGPQTDIYSLGVILYQMLTGKLPFTGSLTSVLRQIVSDEPRKLSDIVPEIGSGSPVELICMKMMAKSRAVRFQTMAEVAEALEALEPPPNPPAPKPSAYKRVTSWLRSFVDQDTPLASSSSKGGGSTGRDEIHATLEIASSGKNEPAVASEPVQDTLAVEGLVPANPPQKIEATMAQDVDNQPSGLEEEPPAASGPILDTLAVEGQVEANPAPSTEATIAPDAESPSTGP